ncbi:MAG TPA: hypothetical protein VGW75_06030 [Solirubrobacteraceae bacterium]|jgi:hypothetical protein|nr:hypothetical protein [Solirubrobacteraceae bacterium]
MSALVRVAHWNVKPAPAAGTPSFPRAGDEARAALDLTPRG